ncbi:MAG: hypothetical protein AB2541_16175, partial [Candidatus Thiodiazotropha sp.]
KEGVVAKSIDKIPEAFPGTSTEDDSKAKWSEAELVTSWFQGGTAFEIRKLQEEDPDIVPILDVLKKGKKPTNQEMAVKSPAA